MVQSLVAASTLLLALSAPLAVHAANLFEELDFPTLQVARSAVQSALERRTRGEAEHWRVSGVARGVVIPRRTWRSSSGHWCREFEETIRLTDGRAQSTKAVRCRARNGRWRQIGG